MRIGFKTRLLLSCGVTAASVWCNAGYLLAQDATLHIPTGSGDIGAVVTNLTNTGFLLWFAWHTCTKAIPALVRDFRDEMAAQRESDETAREKDRELSRKQTEALVSELSSERSARQQREQMLLEMLREATGKGGA